MALRDLKAAWPMVTEMAFNVSQSGCRIRVKDEAGAIVILTGVAAARHLSESGIAA